MSNYLYLIINLSAVSIPLIFSFHPRLRFYNHFKNLLVGFLFMVPVFIVWDIYFTHLKVWGFNNDYLLGINIFNLPLEECLFFICIPFSCIFTYHVVLTLSKNKSDFKLKRVWVFISLVLFVFGFLNMEKSYTFFTFILLSIVLPISPYFINMKLFLKTFFILLIPFSIVNGLLTGTLIKNQVVWYNNNENLSIRLGTIPVEDIFYALLMLLMVMIGYQISLNNNKSKVIS